MLLVIPAGCKTAELRPLQRLGVRDEVRSKAGSAPGRTLEADRAAGTIRLDSETQLIGIPSEAWNYRLGNRTGAGMGARPTRRILRAR